MQSRCLRVLMCLEASKINISSETYKHDSAVGHTFSVSEVVHREYYQWSRVPLIRVKVLFFLTRVSAILCSELNHSFYLCPHYILASTFLK